MKTASLHAGLHLTLDSCPYTIERIVDGTCYLISDKDGSLVIRPKREIAEMLCAGKVTVQGNRQEVKLQLGRDLSTLTDSQRQQLEERLMYLKNVAHWLGHQPTMKGLDTVVSAINEESGKQSPSSVTVYRWWKRWVESGHDPMVLINRKTGSSKPRKFNAHVMQIFHETVSEFYLTRQCLRKKAVYEEMSIRLKRLRQSGYIGDDLNMPSQAQFYRLFDGLDKYEEMAARKGRHVAEQYFRASGAGPVVTRILERVEVDHTPLDVLVVDPITKQVVGRPTLTVYLDYFSKMMLGMEIGFEPPSELSHMRALKNAILTKEYISDFPRIKEKWLSYGIPAAIICDNGLEFHSHNLRRVCQELCIELQFCPKKQPHYKGAVERYLKTLNHSVSHTLPGTTRSNPEHRGDYPSQKQAVYSLTEVNQYVHEWFINIYQQTVHRTTGRTPAALWNEGLKVVEPVLPESLEKLNLILCKQEKRTLSKKGIELSSLFYNCVALDAIRHRSLKNTEVAVRYDPTDLGCIWVLDEQRETFIKAQCTQPEYANGLTMRSHKAIRAAVREKGKQDFDQEKLLEYKASFRQQVAADMKDRSLRKRARAARHDIKQVKPATKNLSHRFAGIAAEPQEQFVQFRVEKRGAR